MTQYTRCFIRNGEAAAATPGAIRRARYSAAPRCRVAPCNSGSIDAGICASSGSAMGLVAGPWSRERISCSRWRFAATTRAHNCRSVRQRRNWQDHRRGHAWSRPRVGGRQYSDDPRRTSAFVATAIWGACCTGGTPADVCSSATEPGLGSYLMWFDPPCWPHSTWTGPAKNSRFTAWTTDAVRNSAGLPPPPVAATLFATTTAMPRPATSTRRCPDHHGLVSQRPKNGHAANAAPLLLARSV
jgi:hypothetical protein